MFNLERAISEWRQQLAAGGTKSSKVLEELESHLREDIRTLASQGRTEAQSFRLAVSRLGDTDSVNTEFEKLSTTSSMPLKIGALLWAGTSTVLVIRLLIGFSAGKPSFLLIAHTFTLTVGYCAAFLTGGFGVYYVCCRWLRVLSPARQQALRRAVPVFSRLSMGLVLAGLLLGMVWSGQNRGGFFAGGTREVGTLYASIWLIAFCVIQRFGRLSNQFTMLLCIGGNLIISLAWFGTGTIAHGNGIASYRPLDALLGVHLFFLAMGVVPTFETTEA
jgi:hypothetical protein